MANFGRVHDSVECVRLNPVPIFRFHRVRLRPSFDSIRICPHCQLRWLHASLHWKREETKSASGQERSLAGGKESRESQGL